MRSAIAHPPLDTAAPTVRRRPRLAGSIELDRLEAASRRSRVLSAVETGLGQVANRRRPGLNSRLMPPSTGTQPTPHVVLLEGNPVVEGRAIRQPTFALLCKAGSETAAAPRWPLLSGRD